MASQQLHVAQRPAGVVNEPGRPSDECPPPRMGRTPVEADDPIGVGKPDDDACGVIGPPRSDTITGPVPWVTARHLVSARRKSSCNGTLRPLPFLAAWSGNSRTVPDGAGRIGDHGPSQVGDLTGS